jgi:hypothetical protein
MPDSYDRNKKSDQAVRKKEKEREALERAIAEIRIPNKRGMR